MELCYTPFDQAAQALGIPVAVGEPMSRHTTFQIGGPADRFAAVETLPQLKALLQALESQGLPYLVLGKGSNLLVSDKGIRGRCCCFPASLKPSRCWRTAWSGRAPGPRWPLCAALSRSTASPAWSLPGASPARWAGRPIWTPAPMAAR